MTIPAEATDRHLVNPAWDRQVDAVRALGLGSAPQTRNATMTTTAHASGALREELQRSRVTLRQKERRRDDLLVETAALRLWEDSPNEERIPAWVTEAAIRRRLDEIEELGREIELLIDHTVRLGDGLEDNPHGTPSIELDLVTSSGDTVVMGEFPTVLGGGFGGPGHPRLSSRVALG